MAKSRYSKSKKGKSRRGKRSRHTKRHIGRRPHHTRRRVRRGGYTPGPPTIPISLGPNQLLSGFKYQGGGGHNGCQGGGVQQSTGSYMNVRNDGQTVVIGPACGRM
jgi:hypothetical protein